MKYNITIIGTKPDVTLTIDFKPPKITKDVKIVNFGIFKLRQKNERVGRNPKTKIEFKISKRNVVKFKASEFLLNTINPVQSNLDEKS